MGKYTHKITSRQARMNKVNNKEIKETIESLAINEEAPVTDLGTAIRTSKAQYVITDNGEAISGLSLSEAIATAIENNK